MVCFQGCAVKLPECSRISESNRITTTGRLEIRDALAEDLRQLCRAHLGGRPAGKQSPKCCNVALNEEKNKWKTVESWRLWRLSFFCWNFFSLISFFGWVFVHFEMLSLILVPKICGCIQHGDFSEPYKAQKPRCRDVQRTSLEGRLQGRQQPTAQGASTSTTEGHR